MTYTVKYKPVGAIFWRTLNKVKGDGYVENKDIRWFILEDETRVEISATNTVLKFSNERFLMIKKDMEKTIGSPLALDSGV